MSDRILAIGIEADHERIESAAFHAVTPLTGFSRVLIDPVSVSALWASVTAAPGAPLTTNAETDGGLGRTLVEVFRRRRREATELVRGGGTLVCVLRPVGRPLYVVRRGVGGQAAAILHAYSWLPTEASLARLVIAAEAGKEIRPADEGSLAWRFIREQGGRARTEAYVANEQLDPAWHVVATDRLGRPVAFEVAVGEGRVIFMPPVAAADAAERGALVARVLEPEPEAPGPTAEPDWLADCLLVGQAELAAQTVELEEEIENLQAELDDVRARHAELALFSKLLYASQPAELAEPVAGAFRAMGFEVDRTDAECLEVRSDEGEAVLALATDQATVDSDPYWVLLRCLDARGAPAKGIIVGNAFCTTPPAERGAPFSDLLHRGAVHRSMALLSTTDLHAVVGALIARPMDEGLRSALRHAILEATGPCSLLPLVQSEGEPEAG